MQQFNVTGMSCAACSARVEKAVSKVDGVTACSVSLLTNSMGVEGGSADAIIRAVEEAGYGASVKGAEAVKQMREDDPLKDRETPVMKRRLYSSLIFLVIHMYISMGHTMWGWPVPAFLENPMANGISQLLLAAIVMVINQKFFISGAKGLIHKAPNMDTLVAMGSAAAFGYSTYALFAMVGDVEHAHHWLHEFYFESAAMILTLITVGKMLEARSKGKTMDGIGILLVMAAINFAVNLALDTNFMFLMYAPEGNPLYWFQQTFGNHFIGFPVLIAAVVAVMYLPSVRQLKERFRKKHAKV